MSGLNIVTVHATLSKILRLNVYSAIGTKKSLK